MTPPDPQADPLPDFPVEDLHVRTFARALGDVHHDGSAAPPTFTIAAAQADEHYPLRPAPGEKWFGSGREPTGYGPDDDDPAAGVLYAEQHFDLERGVRVGEVLTRTSRPGRTWAKEGRRGGTLSFFEEVTELRDADGALVVTSTLIGVRTARRPGDAA
ncbi:MaoC family dehydratase N-terminal domain-containing protein [Nocardioides sp.]|uniref:FAS1-like dehydratase domain-containing protein n=1 Tax=Nocardioides sp. TaxID=35761 RepID=UPI0026146905|nr:MaoC family dehydratase N-terminal domain-containing protein [Nocardioides sp.]